MAFTFCTSGAAHAKAGANVSLTIKEDQTTLDLFSEEVENDINGETRYDWTANYASIGTNFKQALANVASAGIATREINYDMAGYTSRQEALTMLNVLDRQWRLGIAWLKDKQNQEKMV